MAYTITNNLTNKESVEKKWLLLWAEKTESKQVPQGVMKEKRKKQCIPRLFEIRFELFLWKNWIKFHFTNIEVLYKDSKMSNWDFVEVAPKLVKFWIVSGEMIQRCQFLGAKTTVHCCQYRSDSVNSDQGKVSIRTYSMNYIDETIQLSSILFEVHHAQEILRIYLKSMSLINRQSAKSEQHNTMDSICFRRNTSGFDSRWCRNWSTSWHNYGRKNVKYTKIKCCRNSSNRFATNRILIILIRSSSDFFTHISKKPEVRKFWIIYFH